MENIEQLKQWIEESNRIIFFGGAGVSTESGIPDFRSVDGLYHQKYDYPPEEILSHTFFVHHTEDFFRFYKDKMNCLNALPNITHKKLFELENCGKLTSVITQNIDGLHQKAGSKRVHELHGSIHRNYCRTCKTFYTADFVFTSPNIVPICECGGIIKPDVILYEEPLSDKIMQESITDISHSDLLIVAGTSLSVYPASELLYYFTGKHIVLLNRDSTPFDYKADLVIHDTLGNIFKEL